VRLTLVVLSLAVATYGCGDDGGGGDGGVGGDGSPRPMDGSGPVDAVIPGDAPGSELCVGGCECSDGIDNDGDGEIDGMDTECTGPFDDDEGSFATGIPGDNRDPMWQDCFFDGNSGAGDDGCRYHTECLTGDRPPSDASCTVTDRCIRFCRARTPNGCDCFGCCEIRLEDGTTRTVTLGGSCSVERITDERACPVCVQSTMCRNECGRCELCPGRTAADLPPDCYDMPDGGTPMYTCDDGISCMTTSDCPMDMYCQLGCCLGGPI
jgi:hypothetical protein